MTFFVAAQNVRFWGHKRAPVPPDIRYTWSCRLKLKELPPREAVTLSSVTI